MSRTKKKKEVSRATLYEGLFLLVLGLAISSMGYVANFSVMNPDEVVGPALFWIAIVVFLLASPLRAATRAFSRAIRRPAGAGIFVSYLTIHLILYGFVLDAIVASLYGAASVAQSFGVIVTTNLFQPPSVSALIFDVAYNPSIVLTAPPVFGVALSFYGIAVAVIIAILIIANIGQAQELGELRTQAKKARSYVVLPVIGIVLGASCCLSVAGVVALAVPSALASTSVTWIYYTTYFLLPSVAIALLYLNLQSVERIAATINASLVDEQEGSSGSGVGNSPIPPPASPPPPPRSPTSP
jgi:hypothetical protein